MGTISYHSVFDAPFALMFLADTKSTNSPVREVTISVD